MLLGILIFVVFIVAAIAMMKEMIPATIALPIMAVVIAAIGGANLQEIFEVVIAEGATRLAGSIIIVIFSVWLGRVLMNTGIAENIIRKSAEYAGDRPFILMLIVTAASAFILTSIRGLGAYILVGTIALPIMQSVGIPNLMAGTSLLLAYSAGNIINPGTWGIFEGIFGIEIIEIRSFVFILFGILAASIVLYLIYYIKIKGVHKSWSAEPNNLDEDYEEVSFLSMLTPAIPLVLVMGFEVSIIPSVTVGILYAILTTQPGRSVSDTYDLLQKAFFEGYKDAAPAITLMIGIGMLLKAVNIEVVANEIQPVMEAVIPASQFGYVIFFIIAIPFVLYRGPFNMWGLGAGVVTLIIATGYFPPQAIMGAYMAATVVQQAVEPTNTHNVWTATYTDTGVIDILKRTMLWTWPVAAIAIVIASLMLI